MVDNEFGKAAVEVLDILKHVDSEDFKKIPASFIELLEDNKSQDYICNLDHSKKIAEMDLRRETEAILGLIYLNYWADDAGKVEFQQRLKDNEEIFQNELTQGFNEDIFSQMQNVESNNDIKQEYLPQTYEKQGFISKLFSILKNTFKRK